MRNRRDTSEIRPNTFGVWNVILITAILLATFTAFVLGIMLYARISDYDGTISSISDKTNTILNELNHALGHNSTIPTHLTYVSNTAIVLTTIATAAVFTTLVCVALSFFYRKRNKQEGGRYMSGESPEDRARLLEIWNMILKTLLLMGAFILFILSIMLFARIIGSEGTIAAIENEAQIIASDVVGLTTSNPTTGIMTTTAVPTTAVPTTAMPTTAIPTTALATTAAPTTAIATTAMPTTAVPTTALATTQRLTTALMTTAAVTTAAPTTSSPTTGMVCFGTMCNNTCIFTQSDPSHCGNCTFNCSALPNVMSSGCASGQCTSFICNTGYAHCSSNPTTGCETTTYNDTGNCGNCGINCTNLIGVNATTSYCNTSRCFYSCANYWMRNCGNWVTGCTIDTSSDNNNCGSCGNMCTSGNLCMMGVCVGPTTAMPTTAVPTTAVPTTAIPTTAVPTTA